MFVLKGENTYQEELTPRVLFYGGEFGYCFSNFAAFSIVWRERTWQTSEHAFQAAGFDNENIVEEIFTATSAHDALMLAIKYQDQMRPTWDAEKYEVMKDICRHKLTQHPYIQKTIVRSDTSELIEDAPKDNYWGRGADWSGENNLGKIWMELRSEFLAQTTPTT
jgi:N-glycosidase YbiA